MNRLTPLRVWDPSGPTPELGTAHALKLMKEMYAWDIATRSSIIDARGMVLDVTEFDYKAINKVIFDENGVKIRTIPATPLPTNGGLNTQKIQIYQFMKVFCHQV